MIVKPNNFLKIAAENPQSIWNDVFMVIEKKQIYFANVAPYAIE